MSYDQYQDLSKLAKRIYKHVNPAVKEVQERLTRYTPKPFGEKRTYTQNWSIYEKAASLGAPIVIHTGWGPLPQNRITWQEPYVLEDLLIEFPDINISFGHTGCHRVNDALMMMVRHRNLYGDFAYWYFFPFDFLVRALVFAKKIGVFDRLMWGTDFPHTDPKADSERYRKIPEYTKRHELEPLITEEDLEQFFSKNALRFLKKDKR